MTNELPLIKQPLVAPATPEQKFMAATLPPTANQEPVAEAKMPARQMSVEFDLPDGRHVFIRRAKGRDLINATRIASGDAEQGMASAASVSLIDGEPINYDDFLDLDLADCYVILNAYNTLMGN
jgi:hypothetical protein